MEENSNKKFKQTRELVRLALNDGWTQTDIAKACRTNQSDVSAWKKGTRKAKKVSIEPLLERFGHKLRRKAFKVYYGINSNVEKLEWQYFRIEGRVIMDHTFHDLKIDGEGGKIRKNLARRRLIIHHQGQGQYVLLKQTRLGIAGSTDLVACNVEEAQWSTEVIGLATMCKDKLLEYIDQEYENLLNDKSLSDAATLPFLVRRALLYAGENVDGIIDYPAKF